MHERIDCRDNDLAWFKDSQFRAHELDGILEPFVMTVLDAVVVFGIPFVAEPVDPFVQPDAAPSGLSACSSTQLNLSTM